MFKKLSLVLLTALSTSTFATSVDTNSALTTMDVTPIAVENSTASFSVRDWWIEDGEICWIDAGGNVDCAPIPGL